MLTTQAKSDALPPNAIMKYAMHAPRYALTIPIPFVASYIHPTSHVTPLNLTLLDVALLQARIDTKGDAGRNSSADHLDILAVDALAKGSSDEIVAKGKGLVGDLAGAKVLRGEAGDEDGVGAVRVELAVDGALVEGGHHVGAELGADDAAGLAVGREDAVLGRHLGDETALGDDLELDGSGVDVEGVHAAGLDPSDSLQESSALLLEDLGVSGGTYHAGSGADEGGECLAVGSDELTTLSGVGLLLVEVEDELLVIGEELEAVGGAVLISLMLRLDVVVL